MPRIFVGESRSAADLRCTDQRCRGSSDRGGAGWRRGGSCLELGVELVAGGLVVDEDCVYWAVLGCKQEGFAVLGVWLHDDALVLVVEFKYAGSGVDAVAKAEAQDAVNLNLQVVALRVRHGELRVRHVELRRAGFLC